MPFDLHVLGIVHSTPVKVVFCVEAFGLESESHFQKFTRLVLTRTVPFIRIDKPGIERINSCERGQKVGDYPTGCGIAAFGLRLLNKQVEQIEQGLLVCHQLVDNCG